MTTSRFDRSPIPRSMGKVCKGCQRWHPFWDYYPHPETADGLTSKCKACLRQYQREYRARKEGK